MKKQNSTAPKASIKVQDLKTKKDAKGGATTTTTKTGIATKTGY